MKYLIHELYDLLKQIDYDKMNSILKKVKLISNNKNKFNENITDNIDDISVDIENGIDSLQYLKDVISEEDYKNIE